MAGGAPSSLARQAHGFHDLPREHDEPLLPVAAIGGVIECVGTQDTKTPAGIAPQAKSRECHGLVKKLHDCAQASFARNRIGALAGRQRAMPKRIDRGERRNAQGKKKLRIFVHGKSAQTHGQARAQSKRSSNGSAAPDRCALRYAASAVPPPHHINPALEPVAHALDWSGIDTVLLDMDGTLLDLHFDNWFWQSHLVQHHARVSGVSESAVRERLMARFHACAGTLDWYSIEYWSRELALDILALKENVAHEIRFLPGALDFLHRLARTGKRRVLATNAHPAVLAIKAKRTGLLAHVDAAHSSHEFGAPKESPDFWPRLRAKEPFDPARTLFIDDHLPVLRAAAAFGIAHLLAISHPDSAQPCKPNAEFTSIAGVAQISFD